MPASAEELNKSRRMVALQARAFAHVGGTVAILDPTGTGDSGGEHADATWEGWCSDLQFAYRWLGDHAPVHRVLWGLRLGGTLAAAVVAGRVITPHALLLWQPVLSGRSYFNQFLRLATAQALTANAAGASDATTLRTKLASGVSVEVAGYDLHPALVAGADAIDFRSLSAPPCPMIWREVTIVDPPALSAATLSVIRRWEAEGAEVDVRAIAGPSFWASQEITEAPELVSSTTTAIADRFTGGLENPP